MASYNLVLIQHGESTWNLENRFSDWYHADLSPARHEEAKRRGQLLRDAGYEFGICFTSIQKSLVANRINVLREETFQSRTRNEEIIFQIKEGKHVLIAAHVNSLRGTVKHLESLSEEAIMELNLSPGIPIMYELDKNLKPIKPMQFLGDEETEYAMEAVAAQGKAKK